MSTHILVRHISCCNPDGGGSVMRTQTVEVEITWPDKMPPDMTYGSNGQWVVSDLVQP